MLKDLWLFNEVFSVVIFTWFLAQLFKFIIILVREKQFDFGVFLRSGGMPSAHTAVVSSLALAISISQGFNSAIFAIAFIFAVIVIYDAVGVRQAAGDHARALNKIAPRVLKEETKHFKTRIGHKASEVLAGVVLGLIVPLILMWNQINFPSAIRNLFTQNYLFNLNPGSSFKFLIPLAAIFGVLFIAGIILAIISWRNKNLVYKKLFGKIYTLLLTIGAIGFLLLVLRYENAYVLSGRFLWIALFLGFIIWTGIVLYYGIKKFPKDIKTYSDYLRKEKYIPKSKNH